MEITATAWTLREAAAVPLASAGEYLSWGSVLVMAPHPDDEALGCGGVIALLREAGRQVQIVWLTDGRASHPNSREYPAGKLVALRRQEAVASAAALGVAQLHFLDLEDARVPLPPGEAAVKALRGLMREADTVLTPWRLDPHCDHRAAYDYVRAAARGLPVRILEYPIWLWQNGASEDYPPRGEFAVLRVDIGEALPKKFAAIAAHRSQVTRLVRDDPEGFCVPAEMYAHFQEPWELFFSPR